MRAAWAITGALLGGAAVFLAIKPTDRVVHTVSKRSHDAPRPLVVNTGGGTTAVDLEALRDEIRASIHDELSKTPSAGEGAPDEMRAPRSEEGEAALAEVHGLIGSAIGRGHWTAEDNGRLRQLADRLDPSALDEILSAWSMAVNRQELRPDVPITF